MATIAKQLPGPMVRQVSASMPEADRDTIRDPEVARAYLAMLAETFAQGPAGAQVDSAQVAGAWGFDPAGVRPIDDGPRTFVEPRLAAAQRAARGHDRVGQGGGRVGPSRVHGRAARAAQPLAGIAVWLYPERGGTPSPSPSTPPTSSTAGG